MEFEMTATIFDCGHPARQHCPRCKNAAAELLIRFDDTKPAYMRSHVVAYCADCGRQFAFFDRKPVVVQNVNGSLRDYGSVKHLAKNDGADVSLCRPCAEWLPSAVLTPYRRALTQASRELSEFETKLEALQEQIDQGNSDGWFCDDCSSFIDEPCEVRECSNANCETRFDADSNGGRNCPDCNRPFTRKIAEQGCPECLEENDAAHIGDFEAFKTALEGEIAKAAMAVRDADGDLQEAIARLDRVHTN